jgi:homeobox-leucine zipper protein
MFPEDAPLVPSGFRIALVNSQQVESYFFAFDFSLTGVIVHIRTLVINLTLYCFFQGDKQNSMAANRTLDLTSGLEVAPTPTHATGDTCPNNRCVLTVAFQFPFETGLQDNVAAMARQYIRRVVSAVQALATAISPSPSSANTAGEAKLSPGSPEALTLAQWICQSYR